MKKILVALALVILVVASVSLLSTSQVKAEASEVKILSYSWYVAPANTASQAQYAGDLIVVGEVQNMGTNTVGNVAIEADAYNANGSFLASGAPLPPFLSNLSPEQKAPFCLDFVPDITDITTSLDQNWAYSVTNVTAQVVYAVDSSQTQYAGLVVRDGTVSSSNSTGTYTITGTVQNTGDQTTGPVWVISTFYNASGTVVGLNYTDYISQSLSPGRSATFTASPIDNTAQLSSSITSYSILIQSEPAPSATPTPVITPIQTNTSPTSSNQPTSSASPPLGISASLTIYLVAAAIVVILVILSALLLLRRRRRNAEFDLPPPPPPT